MNTQKEDLNFSHQVYKNDPILLKSYVGKKVEITMTDENVHCGVVYTIDPVSERLGKLSKLFYYFTNRSNV